MRQSAGIETPLLLFNQSSDIWAQDFIEPAYASMSGPSGPIAIMIILQSAQSTRTGGRQVFEQLRGPGVGGCQPASGTGSGSGHREINSFGNLETIPPYTSKSGVEYKAGRIVMGKHSRPYLQRSCWTSCTVSRCSRSCSSRRGGCSSAMWTSSCSFCRIKTRSGSPFRLQIRGLD